ncbi:UbiA-like polyprenyltransferase [Aeoliella mucimassa]|uniref:4-hydroxybenzoate polyprenyltransferase n=1 Tax=Aeoliella mucimassa TaxID=2527972 RepID=A0A518AI58_9BACT|nr:UbiA-like polyprenyltransferase [Aeoliella mucimassa]QDU54412.1 4-hydroxybenzoate octaprenyltransferase [Aeoliella mucimassa]
MFKTFAHLLSLIRFSHTLFALPFAMMSAVMAWWLRAVSQYPSIAREPNYSTHIVFGRYSMRFPIGNAKVTSDDEFLQGATALERTQGLFESIRWQELLGILLCMVFARSAAMAFNRLVDRKIDAGNPRTAGRHLPAGILSVAQVTTFAVVCVVGFIASTLLFLPNRLPLYLSVPVLLWLCGYSLAKRFTSLAHFWLGAALAMSPVAAWIAIRGEVVLQSPSDLIAPLTLGGAVLLWVAGFDILYACQDFEFDRTAKLHSVPVRLGLHGALRLAAGCHAGTVLLLAALPTVYPPLGTVYFTGIAAVALLLIYEHWLVKPNDLARVNLAFFHVNAIISIGLLVVTCVDLLVV